jgi:hypothetical protein
MTNDLKTSLARASSKCLDQARKAFRDGVYFSQVDALFPEMLEQEGVGIVPRGNDEVLTELSNAVDSGSFERVMDAARHVLSLWYPAPMFKEGDLVRCPNTGRKGSILNVDDTRRPVVGWFATDLMNVSVSTASAHRLELDEVVPA